ncbi:hypothetical protein T552_00599 [Pneumocystis carinii B80]|uniref:Presequence protease, mitochondrial n=1 Tax=Pneumocystis carinii (strain B80) TaxID=1408658 RepID=A0A0W4ZP21_PNEC8|nr:hypothetical protein T552_00599 [Pneumocystis carinii B80]KTW30121.1 hypothetical protein T552_00599 [Pneumocystis carinii B80]
MCNFKGKRAADSRRSTTWIFSRKSSYIDREKEYSKEKQKKYIKELDLTAVLLKHEKTGAEHLHIMKNDRNNVFAIGFHTPPPNSSGVPHILEHTALCGSAKYPVRDPFFKMLNRSLANFMNAFTCSDHTMYPFATMNPIDYSNLRDIYLDATLFPKLRKTDFLQEGWRLENEDPKDPQSPIVYKGVVYNEMKGQMSNSSYLFYIRYQQQMFKNTIYQNESGGDPAVITDLTHEDLVNYHKKYYHPTNSKFFTYGDFPLDQHLEAINSKISSFDRTVIENVQKNIEPFKSPRRIYDIFPFDPLSDPDSQIKMSISFSANDIANVFETFSFRVLSSLLLDGHSSPLYKRLIETGLGSDWSPNSGYDTSFKTGIFSIGLQGVAKDNIKKIELEIRNVLEEVAEKGFEQHKIDAILHQIELSLKHKSANFGISLMQSLQSGWFNNSDPFLMLSINEIIAKFRDYTRDNQYLKSLICKYILNNTNSLSFIMMPSKTYMQDLSENETKSLMTKVNSLSLEEKKEIQMQALELLKNQETKEDVSCLPTLTIDDIAKNISKVELFHEKIGKLNVQWRIVPTEITYFRAINPLNNLPEYLKPYLPLFAEVLTNLGTHSQTMSDLEDEIKLKTGGLNVSTYISTKYNDLNTIEEGLLFSGHCLSHNIQSMYDLFRKLLLETNFDNVKKLRSLISINNSNIMSSLSESGHSYARAFSASSLTLGGKFSETMSGITQAKLVSKLSMKEDLLDVVDKLKEISKYTFFQESLKVFITCSDKHISLNKKELEKFFSSLPANLDDHKPENVFPQFTPSFGNKAFFPLPYSVNFVSLCLLGTPYIHQDGPVIQILSKLLTQQYLHKEIREKGGAYGSGASYNSLEGIFGFYSYRDPTPQRTLSIFANSGQWAIEHKWTQKELDEAKLNVFQSLDAPISIDKEGLPYFINSLSDEMRQQYRERLLQVNINDLYRVSEKYILKPISQQHLSITVLGEKKKWIEQEEQWKIFDLNKDVDI